MQDIRVTELAINHVNNWFNVHSDQRMRMMNFYIMLLAATVTLLSSKMAEKSVNLLFLIGSTLLIITFVFKCLDLRTAELVKHSETALQELESSMSDATKIDLNLIKLANNRKAPLSYRQAFNVLFGFGILIAIFCFLFALNIICH